MITKQDFINEVDRLIESEEAVNEGLAKLSSVLGVYINPTGGLPGLLLAEHAAALRHLDFATGLYKTYDALDKDDGWVTWYVTEGVYSKTTPAKVTIQGTAYKIKTTEDLWEVIQKDKTKEVEQGDVSEEYVTSGDSHKLWGVECER